MLYATVLGMVWMSMGGYENPYGLVPTTWDRRIEGFYDRFHTVQDCGGLGFELETKSF